MFRYQCSQIFFLGGVVDKAFFDSDHAECFVLHAVTVYLCVL